MAEDALARARAIAAKLSGGISGGTDLGKRKNRWDDDPSPGGYGLGVIKKKKVYVPVKEFPGVNFLGLLIGPRGATQKQLQELSGAKILIRGRGATKDATISSHPDDDDDLHVSIEGTEDAIKKAENQIQQILYNPEQAMKLKDAQLQSLAELNNALSGTNSGQLTPYKGGNGDDYILELKVPNNMVGLVIGKGGENIHRMQAQTGATMQIAKESDMKPGETMRCIWLKGPPSSVQELKNKVEEIVNTRLSQLQGGGPRGPNSARSNTNNELDNYAYIIKLPVPNDKVGVVIGKGGATVKMIQEKTGAIIQIPPGPDDDNPQVRTLSLGADTKEAADACQMEIFLVLQTQQQQQVTQQMNITNALHIAVPDDKVGLIIGKGGMTIKDIQYRTRVKIQIPQSADPGSNPPVRTLSILGPPECQHLARYEIELVVSGQTGGGTSSSSGGGGGGYSSSSGNSDNPWAATAAITGATPAYNLPYYPTGTAAAMYPSTLPTAGYDMTGGYYGTTPTAASSVSYTNAGYPGYDPTGATYSADTAVSYDYSTSTTAGATAYQPTSTTTVSADTSSAASTSAVVPTDPTAYYNDYWLYASYYGEMAARAYYGTWSPPEGTPSPEGMIIPSSSTSTTDAQTSSSTTAVAAAVAAPSSSTTSTNPEHTSSSSSFSNSHTFNGHNETVTNTTTTNTNNSNNSKSNSNNPVEDIISTDPEAQAAWEAYKKQYAEWYEAYGKAAGADPNPPRPQ